MNTQTWEDIGFLSGSITVRRSKHGEARYSQINPSARSALRLRDANNGWAFACPGVENGRKKDRRR
jgi:hypothetical protein